MKTVAKRIVIDGLLKIGGIAFAVPTIMFFLIDVFNCFNSGAELRSNLCGWSYMEGIRQGIVMYVFVSALAGIVTGLLFVIRDRKSRETELP